MNRVCSPQPRMYFYFRFGLFRFRSPLLTKSIFLSSPVGTQMFQFPTSPSLYTMYSCMSNWSFFTSQVSPFGFPRIQSYLKLPVDYRSLSRPSSALGAKAFSLCSLQLNLFLSSFELSKSFLVFGLIVLLVQILLPRYKQRPKFF